VPMPSSPSAPAASQLYPAPTSAAVQATIASAAPVLGAAAVAPAGEVAAKAARQPAARL
jgi:hypothetical protein